MRLYYSSLSQLNLDPREFLKDREFTVLWSGGKDSTATLLWVLDNVKHDNWDVLYIEVTGNTHPLCTQYVVDTAKQLGIYNKLKIAIPFFFSPLNDFALLTASL